MRDDDDIRGDELEGDDILGDDTAGDEIVGDDILGDEIVGDQLVGDDILGDDLLGDAEVGAIFRRRRRRRQQQQQQAQKGHARQNAIAARKFAASRVVVKRPLTKSRVQSVGFNFTAVGPGATVDIPARPQVKFRGTRLSVPSSIAHGLPHRGPQGRSQLAVRRGRRAVGRDVQGHRDVRQRRDGHLRSGDGHHHQRHQHERDRVGLPRDPVRRRRRVTGRKLRDVGGGRSPERSCGESVTPRRAFRAGGAVMMQPIVFKVKLLRGADDLVRSEKGLLWLLEALCKINEGHLEQFPYALQVAGVTGPIWSLYRTSWSTASRRTNASSTSSGCAATSSTIYLMNSIRIGAEHGDHRRDQEELAHGNWSPADVDAEYQKIVDHRLISPRHTPRFAASSTRSIQRPATSHGSGNLAPSLTAAPRDTTRTGALPDPVGPPVQS